MNYAKVFLILNIVLISVVQSSAQQLIISEELNMRNDFAYYLVPVDKEIFLVRDKAIKIIFQHLRQDQNWTIEKELDLEGKKWKLLDVFKHEDKIGVLYTSKVDKSYKCFYTVFDQNGIKKYQRLIASSIDILNQEIINFQSSENKAFVSIGLRDKNNKPWIILFNRLQDSIYYTLDANQYLDSENEPAEESLLGNNGDFYLRYEYENPEKSKNKYLPKVIGLNAQGEKILDLIISSSYEVFSTKLALSNMNQEVLIGGLFSKAGEQDILGYFNQNLSKESNPSFFNFDEKKMKEWMGKKSKSTISHNEMQTKAIRFLIDGSVLLFLENVKQYIRRPYFGGGTDNGSSFVNNRWIDYYYDDIVVCCISPQREKLWETILRKKQFSQDDDGINSSFFIVSNKSLLRLLFNDEIKNESTVSEYILLADGTNNRKSLLNTSNSKLNLRIRDAIQIDAQTVIIPNENNGKLSIVQLNLN
ncbi:MAG: hypothetical protein ABIO44_04705 [Saprospiraceae bacterium]